MPKITSCLWFDGNAEEAVAFYTSLFPRSNVGSKTQYGEASAKESGQPKGAVMTIDFQLAGQDFVALNGGPLFKFTPAISFSFSCATRGEIDELYAKLSAGGKVLMALDKYPFSERYCWIDDRFGVSWQLNLAPAEQKITPSLLFVGRQHGRAVEAMTFYTSIFRNSGILMRVPYEKGEDTKEGTIKYGRFSLGGREFVAMDSGLDHKFAFTPAVSFMVLCETQQEIDAFWKELSDGGKELECGWLEDRFGVSWQIVPSMIVKWLHDRQRTEAVMKAVLTMKKLDIAVLERAYKGA